MYEVSEKSGFRVLIIILSFLLFLLCVFRQKNKGCANPLVMGGDLYKREQARSQDCKFGGAALVFAEAADIFRVLYYYTAIAC